MKQTNAKKEEEKKKLATCSARQCPSLNCIASVDKYLQFFLKIKNRNTIKKNKNKQSSKSMKSWLPAQLVHDLAQTELSVSKNPVPVIQ